jgi:hypothetical protein
MLLRQIAGTSSEVRFEALGSNGIFQERSAPSPLSNAIDVLNHSSWLVLTKKKS